MRARFAALLMVALGQAACNSDTSGPPTAPPTAAQRAEIQSTIVAELPVTLSAVAATDGGVGGGSWIDGASSPLGCATFSGTADTDGDGVGDNVTVTFAVPACRFTVGTANIELTGGIRLVDPTPSIPDRSYSLTYQNLALAVLTPDPAQALRFTYSGTRNLSATTTDLTLANDIGATIQRGSETAAQFQHKLSAQFTANAGSPPITVATTALPSGTISVAGTFQWHRDDAVFGLAVTTATTLTYDATCAASQKVTAGAVRATFTDGSFYTVTWAGCGVAPTMTFTAATA